MRKFRVQVNGRTYEVEVEELGRQGGKAGAEAATPSAPATGVRATAGGPADVVAPLPGLIIDVRVEPGQTVGEDDVVVVLEAMKMENELTAMQAGTVADVRVEVGQTVGQGDVLVVLE